jgi:integrase
MLRNADQLSRAEVANLIRDCFTNLAGEFDRPFTPHTSSPCMEREELRAMINEHLALLLEELEGRQFSSTTTNLMSSLASDHNVDVHQATPARMQSIAEGVVRARIEADRLMLFRTEDGVMPYSPQDPLFTNRRDIAAGIGLTVGELVEEYKRKRKAQWTPKTYATHTPKLQLLADFLGTDRRAEDISRADLLPFPDALLRLRRNHQKRPATTFQARQTNAENARITAATASTILTRSTAMFRWAFEKGYISTNPATGLTITKPKAKKGHKSRRPFTAGELKALFTSPMYTGHLTRRQRYLSGPQLAKDDDYWLPIIAYYSGARLGELVQLHFADCIVDGPFPHLSINENGQEKHGEADHKHVKSEAGVRIIPLHPDVIELGFAKFVQIQKRTAGKRKRVFYGIPYGADGQPSSVYSKWFGRYLTNIGLDDPALVFHSFRHTAEDFFRSSQVPKYIIDQVIGHQDRSAAAAYGSGVTLEVASSVVAGLTLPLNLTSLLRAYS